MAALTACKLTVINAMSMVVNPAAANTSQLIFILYAKSCNHLCIAHQAKGNAMMKAITTSFRKLMDNRPTTLKMDAPTPSYADFFGALNGSEGC